MSKPSPHGTSLLARPLTWLTGIVLRWPVATLGLAGALALVAVVYASVNLKFRTSRLDLINPESDYNKLWIDYIDDFGNQDDVVVVVEAETPEQVRAGIERAAEEILRRSDLYADVLYRVDPEALRAKGLHYLSPQQINRLQDRLPRALSLTRDDFASLQLSRLLPQLALATAAPEEATQHAAGQQFAAHVDNLTALLEGRASYRSPWTLGDPSRQGPLPSDLAHLPEEYLLTADGRMGLILLTLEDDGQSRDQFDQGTEPIGQLRQMLDRLGERHPQIEFGLTGLPVMENDEMRASQRATFKASVISLLGVAALFVAGFGGLRHPLMTVASLLLALCWSLGYVTLSVGHLNILSMSFGVILIGLGIDFGIHYLARYLHLRTAGQDSRAALLDTATVVGPGIVVGGVTTAIAFLTAKLTRFTGVAELGVIASGGILLCVAAAVLVLPAILWLLDRHAPQAGAHRPLSIGPALRVHEKLPSLTVLLALVLTGVTAWGLRDLWYDHNLLNLQPVGLESVELEKRLLEQSDQSVWFALSLADSPEELLARKRQFEQLPAVERTEEIVSLLHTSSRSMQAHIGRMRDQLSELPDESPLLPVDQREALIDALGGAFERLEAARQAPETQERLRTLGAALADSPPAAAVRAVASYQQQLANDLLAQLHRIKDAADPNPPAATDLPASLTARFVGKSGRHLLKVYSKADIWDMEQLEQFVREVRQVDPAATGKPLQTYEGSREMLMSYIHAALYALIAVAIVLVIDFRHLPHVLLALVPVAMGTLQMLGLLGLFQIPLNPANMIVLPLILGIGLDDGVHVVHDYRSQQGRPYRLSRSTATAVLITSLTTMIGFGSLMVAEHRGLHSLGRVLTIGVSCCLFTSLVPLPAILALISRATNKPQTEPPEHPAGAAPALPPAPSRAAMANPPSQPHGASAIHVGITSELEHQ